MKSFVLFLWVIITLNYNSHIGTTSDESNTNWLTLVTKYTMFQKENKTLFIELVGSIKKYKNFFFTLNSNNPYLINKESQGFFVSSYAKGLMLLKKIRVPLLGIAFLELEQTKLISQEINFLRLFLVVTGMVTVFVISKLMISYFQKKKG